MPFRASNRASATNNAAIMDNAVRYIQQNRVTDKFQIVKVLMEAAEKISNDGPTKKHLVLESYAKVAAANAHPGTYSAIPITTIELIIDAFIYASKSVMEFNQQTNCWSSFMALFKKSPATTTGTTGTTGQGTVA